MTYQSMRLELRGKYNNYIQPPRCWGEQLGIWYTEMGSQGRREFGVREFHCGHTELKMLVQYLDGDITWAAADARLRQVLLQREELRVASL